MCSDSLNECRDEWMNEWRENSKDHSRILFADVENSEHGQFPHRIWSGALNYFRGGQWLTGNRPPGPFFDSCTNAQSPLGKGKGDLNKPRK